jgi:1-hydroxy-2-naphthoate dioxygenase
MTQASTPDSLQVLAADLAAAHLRGQWQNEYNRADAGWVDNVLAPKARGDACLWRGADVTAFLERAAVVLPESLTARRSILFNNPGLPKGSVDTINMGIQYILPGELAWAHRHTISALRFIIKGDRRLVTVVNGTACPMETGDLVLTPGGDWHDHSNGADEPAIWLDVLDGPVINALNQAVQQNYGDRRQPIDNAHPAAQGARLRFPWAEVGPQLEKRAAKDADPRFGHIFNYRDPATGAHPMATLGCRMRRFPAGFAGQDHKTRSNQVFHAFRGAGRVVADGRSIDWEEGDCFVVPSWATRRFEVAGRDDAYVFESNDEPLLEKLGLLGSDLPAGLAAVA